MPSFMTYIWGTTFEGISKEDNATDRHHVETILFIKLLHQGASHAQLLLLCVCVCVFICVCDWIQDDINYL